MRNCTHKCTEQNFVSCGVHVIYICKKCVQEHKYHTV